VGPVRGSERRVIASEVSSTGTALGRNWGALGGHFRGEEAPSWLVLVCGVFGKSVGAWWGLSQWGQ
jgi:hypothetical protein